MREAEKEHKHTKSINKFDTEIDVLKDFINAKLRYRLKANTEVFDLVYDRLTQDFNRTFTNNIEKNGSFQRYIRLCTQVPGMPVQMP